MFDFFQAREWRVFITAVNYLLRVVFREGATGVQRKRR
jgi:hypothetical protein